MYIFNINNFLFVQNDILETSVPFHKSEKGSVNNDYSQLVCLLKFRGDDTL